jgi:hypothetical protein
VIIGKRTKHKANKNCPEEIIMSSSLLITPVLIIGDVKFIFDDYLQTNGIVNYFILNFPSHNHPFADVVKHNFRDTKCAALVKIATYL